MASLRSSLDHAVLKPDDELWEKCEDLEDRLMEILSHEVVPLDTKDFSKPFSKPSYKIAALVVPKFNGKIENWISFWEEFDHAINKKLDMDDCTKLVYLKQATLDPSLKSTIADLRIQDKAYSTAIKLLQDRFNKPRIIYRQCCESLKNIPTNTNSGASLTDLADKLQHILTGLTRLESLGASEILTSMAEMSMNKELKHEWLTHTSKLTTTPPVEKVIAFIRERADQAEGEEIISSTRIEYPPCRYSCPLCPENHYPYHCDVFKGYTPRQRNNHVQTHSLCSSCLKPGHAVAACRSTFRCKTCRAQHNSLLHEDQSSVATPAIGSTNAAISKENYKLKDTLFMTADVLLRGTNGITLTARAFLDNGAGLSIVSCAVRKRLALRSTGDSVEIDGVGGIAVDGASPLVRVALSSSYKKGWKKDITVAVMPKPARDIPLQKASDTKDLSHLQGLILADQNYDKPGPIDILLGQDVWDQVFLNGKILGPEGTPSA